MRVGRLFTANKTNPYEGLEFEQRQSELKNPDGSEVSAVLEVTVPKATIITRSIKCATLYTAILLLWVSGCGAPVAGVKGVEERIEDKKSIMNAVQLNNLNNKKLWLGDGATILATIAATKGGSISGIRKLNELRLALNTAMNTDLKLIDMETAARLRAVVRLKLDRLEYEVELVKAASVGDIEGVDRMVGISASDFDLALVEAARGGHTRVVQRMIELDADEFDEAMISAAGGGQLKIVKLMIKYGADEFDEAILAAQRSRHGNLAKFLEKEKGECCE